MVDVYTLSTVSAVDRLRRSAVNVRGRRIAFDWGSPDELGTTAFWVHQTANDSTWVGSYRLGASLSEEVAACMLGGYGVPGPIGVATFENLRAAGVLARTPPPPPEELSELLRQPVAVAGRDQKVRYRFWRQRAIRLHGALVHLDNESAPTSPLELRDWLCSIDGVGMKTASWIVRNHLNSDDVAIVDIHIRRAGVVAGFFDPEWQLPRDYLLFEDAFLQVASMGGVRASALDVCIWATLSALGPAAEAILGANFVGIDRREREVERPA